MSGGVSGAAAIAAALRDGRTTAQAVVAQALETITALDPALNCFTATLKDEARGAARRTDAVFADKGDGGALAGVPFAVNNLFDIAGLTTLAGSRLYASHPAAERDATAVAKLRAAGAVLVGATNMDEFAFGFTTENPHFGPTRNPHDPERSAGGSSGGAAAAVAAGMVPLALGTDTNGSVRVPAALCGVFGFKPTYARLSRAGTVALAPSFDHVGIFARHVGDIALAYDVLQGRDARDPICSGRQPWPTLPVLDSGLEGLRIAVADGYFATGAMIEAFDAVAHVAEALGATSRVSWPEAERAYAAAMLITACEAAALHLDALKDNPDALDGRIRDRLTAAALAPAGWVSDAQRFRRAYRDGVTALFRQVDLVLAPTTPFPAPRLGQESIEVAGSEVAVRPALGRFTSPVSFIGLPALSVPVRGPGKLPLGVQIIAGPWQEPLILRAARVLEDNGVLAATVATP